MLSVPGRGSPADRQRTALLALAKTLAQTRQGGPIAESLDLILGGLGADRGLAFRVADTSFDLVGDRGASAELRRALARVPDAPAWSIVHAAKRARGVVVDREFGATVVDRCALDASHVAGWDAAVACPIVAGRRALAIVVVGLSADADLDADARAFLETACHVIGIALGRESASPLRDSERLLRDAHITALGVLAASVVEDLRAPLAALALGLKEQERIVAELSRVPPAAREAAQLAELLAEAHTALRRARDVTNRLVAAVEQPPHELVDVATVVREALEVVRRSFEERGVAVEASLDKGCWVRGRPDELSQLVIAMLHNALDACDSAGAGADAPRKLVRATVRDETARIVVCVEDSGPGVPADLRAKIFAPFFTTKGGRIGVGLTLCRQTVLAHKGHLELSRSVDLGGASFRVVLPSSREQAPDAQKVPSTTPPMGTSAGGRPRVVWIDDEELFLSSMRRGLPEWDLLTAKTAAEGEALVLARAPRVVFCDVGLPDRSGHELHASIAKKDPELAQRFVFVTGGIVTPEIADYLIASGCPTLLKPVELEEIRELVEGRDQKHAKLTARTLREAPTVPPPSRRRTPPP